MDYLILKFDTNNLHMDIWYQVFLGNSNKFQTVIWLFDGTVIGTNNNEGVLYTPQSSRTEASSLDTV